MQPDPKLGDRQSKASPPVSRILLEAVAANALNNSAGDRQHREPLRLGSFQARLGAEVDAFRVSPISWEA